MKTIITAALILIAGIAISQNKKPKKIEVISIQTDAICGDCEERIENKLNYVKGIKFADLTLKDMKVEVKFKTKKISAKEIKHIISELGYDADEVKGNTVNRAKLPGCCQPGIERHKD